MSSAKRTIRQPSPNDHRYLRIQEAAAYLGATAWYMYTLTWKKAIPFVKVGKRIVFDRLDLDNHMQNSKTGAV